MITNLNFLENEMTRIKLYFRLSQKTRREFDITTGLKMSVYIKSNLTNEIFSFKKNLRVYHRTTTKLKQAYN